MELASKISLSTIKQAFKVCIIFLASFAFQKANESVYFLVYSFLLISQDKRYQDLFDI